MLLARWMVGVFVVLAGNQLPRATTIAIDGRVLAFTAAISLVVGVFCGLWPLLRLRPRDLTGAVREGDTRTASAGGRRSATAWSSPRSPSRSRCSSAPACCVKNLLLLDSRDAGMRTERIVSFNVAPSGPRYEAPEQVVAFYHELYARLTAIEGVESAGMTSHLPMVDFGWNGEFQIEGNAPWTRRTRRRSSSTAGSTASISRRLRCRCSRGGCSTRATAKDRRPSSSTRRWPTSSGPARIRSASGSVRATIALVVRSGRRHRQHPLARPGAQQPVRVLPDDRSGVVRLDGRRRSAPAAGDPSAIIPDRAPDRGVDRSHAADHRVQTMETVVPVGGPAAADVGVDGLFGVARGAAGDDWRLRRDVLQRPPAAPRVRHSPRARRRRSERAQSGRRRAG